MNHNIEFLSTTWYGSYME